MIKERGLRAPGLGAVCYTTVDLCSLHWALFIPWLRGIPSLGFPPALWLPFPVPSWALPLLPVSQVACFLEVPTSSLSILCPFLGSHHPRYSHDLR